MQLFTIIWLCALAVGRSARAEEVLPSRGLENHVQTTSPVYSLPAIRRVGILPVESNIGEFRTYMESSARAWKGLAAQPWTPREVSVRLGKGLRSHLAGSGRFWLLHSDALLETGQRPTPQQIAGLRADFDLDAWVDASVYFSPDHTNLRVFLRNGNDPAVAWLREDIVLPAQPSEQELLDGLESALVRLRRSLGHNASLVWRRNNLTVIDAGSRHGLVVGQRLFAGYVLLTAWHPRTMEFLRSKRVAIMELETVEVREDAAVCRVRARNDVERRTVERLLGTQVASSQLLVWSDMRTDPEWQEALPATPHMLIGNAERGFQTMEERSQLEKARPPAAQSLISEIEGQQETSPHLPADTKNDAPLPPSNSTLDPSTQLPRTTPTPPPAAWAPSSPDPTEREQPRYSDGSFAEKILGAVDAYSIGAGVTYGWTESRIGKGQTGFSPTLLNSFESVTESRFEPDWRLDTRLGIRYFSESARNVSGHLLSLSVQFLSTFHASDLPGRIHLGLAPMISIGQITTHRTVTSTTATTRSTQTSAVQPMSYGGISAIGQWVITGMPEFRRLGLDLELSLDAAVQGELDVTGRVQTWLTSLPKEIGISFLYRKGPRVWEEFGVWFHWMFVGVQ